MNLRNHKDEIRRSINNPRELCELLGFIRERRDWDPQRGGVMIRCPFHQGRDRNCSVRATNDGIVWKCFSQCGRGGDVFDMIAVAHGLSASRDFVEVLTIGAEIAGLSMVVDDLKSGGVGRFALRPVVARTPVEIVADKIYPPVIDMLRFWDACLPADKDVEASGWLASRALDPQCVAAKDLARVVPVNYTPAKWMWSKYGSWPDAGYRIVVPMHDHDGRFRSVRGCAVRPLERKRTPPSGYKSSGLIMANELATEMLSGNSKPSRLIICEGEPDYLTWSTRNLAVEHAVIGIVSGSWTANVASNIPSGCIVFIRADKDEAGIAYECRILQSLSDRCIVRTWSRAGVVGDQNDLLLAGKLPSDPALDSRPLANYCNTW